MGILEKIKDIELEMSRTQKNKATEGHLGILKSNNSPNSEPQASVCFKAAQGSSGEGFDVVVRSRSRRAHRFSIRG